MKKWAIAAAVAVMAFVTGCAGPSGPQDVTGEWSYTKDVVTFDATVTEDNIEIYLTLDGTKGLYWVGTFESPLEDGQVITSTGDTEALSGSLYGSLDETKTFTYVDGHIVYEFGIMGTTRDIQLSK